MRADKIRSQALPNGDIIMAYMAGDRVVITALQYSTRASARFRPPFTQHELTSVDGRDQCVVVAVYPGETWRWNVTTGEVTEKKPEPLSDTWKLPPGAEPTVVADGSFTYAGVDIGRPPSPHDDLETAVSKLNDLLYRGALDSEERVAVATWVRRANEMLSPGPTRQVDRGVPGCSFCDGRLYFADRERGDGLCGPCHRASAKSIPLAPAPQLMDIYPLTEAFERRIVERAAKIATAKDGHSKEEAAIPLAPGDHVMLRLNQVEEQRHLVVEVNAPFVTIRPIGADGSLLAAADWNIDWTCDSAKVRRVDPIPTHEPSDARGRCRLKPGHSL